MNKRFQKGQLIYKATNNFQTYDGVGIAPIRMGAVIERQVDACGAKQITFYDRGMDSIYSRKDRADSLKLFCTPEEAFAALRSDPLVDVICPDVVSDSDREIFRSGHRIAPI